MITSHPIPEVARLRDHVHRVLYLLDVEYDSGTPSPLPSELRERYRIALVVARGIPALEALAEWSRQHLPREFHGALVSRLAEAMAALHQRLPERAEAALLAAEASLVTDVPRGLDLSQAARLAVLSGTLVVLADLITAGMSCDLAPEPADCWSLFDAPTDEAIVAVVGSVLHYFAPRQPEGITPLAVREAFTRTNWFEHNGIVMFAWAAERGEVRRHAHAALLVLLWAVESGELRRLGPSLHAGDAERDREERAFQRWRNGSARTAS